MSDKYNNFLKSQEWYNIRAELRRIYNAVGVRARCTITGEKRYLQIHHLVYREYCGEKLHDLMFLRGDWHHKCHDYIKENGLKLKEGTLEFVEKHKDVEFTSYDVVTKFHKNKNLASGKMRKVWKGKGKMGTSARKEIEIKRGKKFFDNYLNNLRG